MFSFRRMAQGQIQSRLLSNLHQTDKNEALDLHTKLSIQAKQNTLPKVTFGPPSQPLANDLEKLRSKYIVLTPKHTKLKIATNKEEKTSEISKKSIVNANVTRKVNGENVKSSDGIQEPRRIFFPIEKVKNQWTMMFSTKQGFSGLQNMGNTCYLNASLQCLMHTPTLVNILLLPESHPARRDSNGMFLF